MPLKYMGDLYYGLLGICPGCCKGLRLYGRLGTILPLFTELPLRGHLGNPSVRISLSLRYTLLGCRLRVDQEAQSDTGMGPCPLADPIDESTDEVLRAAAFSKGPA
jgi:hypothetical protein